MSKFDLIRVGNAADFEQSAGFQEWKRRRARGFGRPDDAVGHQPRPARSASGSRFATLRRDLEAIEMKAGAAVPPVVSVPARVVSLSPDARGHFCAQVGFQGCNVPMMIDTGATFCSLTEEDAERIGIRLQASNFTERLSTQNGYIKVAPISVTSMQIGSINMRDVEAMVARTNPGAESLLGMSFLGRLSQVSMQGGRLTLRG